MKRFFATVFVIVVIGIAVIYIFIPAELNVSSITIIRANGTSVYRSLAKNNTWKIWWPVDMAGNNPEKTGKLLLNGYGFASGLLLQDGIEVLISNKKATTSSLMRMMRLSADSVVVDWRASLKTTLNPFIRIEKYKEAKRIKQSMQDILAHLKLFAETKKNIYGIDIRETRVTDTILMVKKIVQKEKPTTKEVYSYITDLSKYIGANGAVETNHPMLHSAYNSGLEVYEIMVAIPVNMHLPGNNSIVHKRMVAGHILTAEVIGGETTVEEAIRQMENYASDHEKTSPALPYQLLVTDRMKVTDSSKWITRIYYPVL